MAKNSIRDYDATAANNTDVQSTDISEGCAASGINNAIREVMADLKDVSTGTVALETPSADQLNVDNIRIDGNTISSTDTNGNISLDPDGTGDVIVASGNFGIGTSSPAHLVDAIVASGSATARFGTTHNSGDNDGTVIISNGGSGDAMLRFDYEGTNTDRARIGVTSSGQQLEFYTAGNNERMRIDSSGRLMMGTTNFSFPFGEAFLVDGNDGHRVLCSRASTAAREQIIFYNPNGDVGSIDTSGSSTSYNTSSDHRLKENVADMTGAIDRVKALAPKRFNFIRHPDTTVDGFLAHEAQAVVPEAVTGTHNEVDDDGNAVMQGIDQSKLVPLLTGALKEAIAKIEALETSNADLTARIEALETA